MTVIKDSKHECLRLGIGVSGLLAGLDRRGQSGVVYFKEIPVLATVTAVVHRPTELIEVSDALTAQPYKLEYGPFPDAFIAAGVLIGGPPADGQLQNPRTLSRVYNATAGTGSMIPTQIAPSWTSADTGSLVQGGRKHHSFQMPGNNVSAKTRRVLRLRWTATALTAQSQNARLVNPLTLATGYTPDGTRKSFKGQLVGVNIAPGSVKIRATIGTVAKDLFDMGDGRLVGPDGDGFIDYLEGVFVVTWNTAPDGASTIAADYEKDCGYKPLDANVEWDALLQ